MSSDEFGEKAIAQFGGACIGSQETFEGGLQVCKHKNALRWIVAEADLLDRARYVLR